MARSSIEVELRIYQQLCDVYNRKFGESPKNLVQTLNQHFADERKVASAKNPYAKKDLVSERTIQNFFKDADGRKLSLVNLNYLCQVMLGGSYRDVEEGKTKITTRETVPDAYGNHGYSSQKGLSLDAAIQLQEVNGQIETPPLETWLDAYQEQVRQHHSSVRIPAMRQAKSLESVYVDAGLSKDLKIRKKKDFLQLLRELEGSKQEVHQILTVPEILQAHRRTMIWGAAGAGKTTLLKNIVCHPHVIGEIIPIFIVLADYARALEADSLSLVTAVYKEFKQNFSRISGDCPRLTDQDIDAYLKQGDFFVVLDGLDEVPTKTLPNVQDQVANLVKQYPSNHYVLACRFGTTDYVPQDFIEVEVSRWTPQRIEEFVRKWFEYAEKTHNVDDFLKEIKGSLVASDIVRTPLLLTMLCQLYEDGYELPRDEIELMEDAVDLYLRKWDSSRRVRRNTELDDKLSRQRRKELFATIAYIGMMKGKRIWRRQDLEELIEASLEKIQGVTPETLETDVSNVLYLLETHHGLLVRASKDTYVFSHRSFQEYFTAMQVMTDLGHDTKAIAEFIEHRLTDRQFREVFYHVLSRQKDAEPFLKAIRVKMDQLISRYPTLEQWLVWLDQITRDADVSSAAWRVNTACFDLETSLFFKSDPAVDRSMAQRLSDRLRAFNKRNPQYFIKNTQRIRLVSRLAAIHNIASDRAQGEQVEFDKLGEFVDIYKELPNRLEAVFTELIPMAKEAELETLAQLMDDLLQRFPEDNAPSEDWATWAHQLQDAMQEHLQIGYDHAMKPEDEQALDNYIYLASLITDVVLGDSQCSAEFRREIVESLFLPPTQEVGQSRRGLAV